MNKRFINLLQWTLVLADFCCINIVFICTAFFFRQYNFIGHEFEYSYLNIFLNIAWLAAVVITNTYNKTSIISFEDFTKLTMRSYVYFLLLVIVYLFFLKMITLSRMFVLTVLLITGIILIVTRIMYLAVYQYNKKNGWLLNKVMVIGYNNLSKKLVSFLANDINVQVIGYCEERENIKELSHYPILGNINNALQVCKEHGITEIYSTIAPEHNSNLYNVISNAERQCIRFKLVPDLGFFMKRQMHIDHLNGIPVVALRNEPLQDIANRIKKRFIDVIISSFVIVFVLSWLMPLISFYIWIESKGSTFFLQQRTGRNNKPFTCIKFRSMFSNDAAHEKQATRFDDRVTNVGKFLRRTSLDELPQFINVFKGEMSIIGPRPHMLKHTDEYARQIDDYMVRQFLKPGISGWAQINGWRGETQALYQMKKRVECDIWYMENWSLLLDLKIMVMTIFNVFRKDTNAF